MVSLGNTKVTIRNYESPAVHATTGGQSVQRARARNVAHGHGVISVLSLALCAALAGCGTAPATPERVAPEPGRAVVVGWGNTAGEAAKLIFKSIQGTVVSTLHVSKVNGQAISYGQNVARVAPGEYDLTIACGIYVADRYFPSDSVIRADLKGNHVYRLRAEPQARKCYPYLEDITGKE
jgi:hypothetical protein